MLSLDSMIVESDICNAKALAPRHPVFLIEGYGNEIGVVDALVIKQEFNQKAANVGLAAAMMTEVDPNARTVVLGAAEIAELRAWCEVGGVGHYDHPEIASEILQQLGAPGAWVKMAVKKLITLDSAVTNRVNGDKADVRVIARDLRNPGGLEKLGEIIAVDLFNGNNDRFVWPAPGGSHPALGKQFLALQNVGNVFIACADNGPGVPIGLDNFDPNNSYKDLNGQVDKNWSGHLLTQARVGDRRTFVQNVVADLEYALGPRSRKIPFATKKRLGSRRRERILNGMASGQKKLKDVLVDWRSKRQAQLVPVGISSRMTALGW